MLLHHAFGRLIRRGRLTVRYPDGQRRSYGSGDAPFAGMNIRTPRALRGMTFNPGLALGEGYMEDTIRPDGCSLYELLDLLVLNLATGGTHPAERAMATLRWPLRWFEQLNPAGRSQRNVAHHYDLDDRLYAMFLDADRQYSCAYFPTGRETLEEAQAAKKRHIAAKLLLERPGLEVLDIGSGWGGLAIELARDWGARVTGITLSSEQLEVSRARAQAAGLADRVRFELMDYRAWDRPMDRIVSVGMFEHVGIAQYRAFFAALRRTLRPDGVALVHAIGRSDGPGTTNPWLAKYIFPGGYSPALSEVLPVVEGSGLLVTDIEILRLHYAHTISAWRARFDARREEIAALYDERFCRMFEFYLAGCEIAFRRGGHMNWQMQLAAREGVVPMSRAYMVDAERAARQRQAAPAE
ncbi:MAG: cyclopropane-fatty-acyl-phospholipid synthase family protein [Pseudomonadota bacterium]